MKTVYNTERLFEDLFDFRRDFDEMFNRILTGKAVLPELPAFKEEFNLTPAVETYVDKDAKKYVCRIALPGVESKDVQVNVLGNQLVIRGERKLTHRAKETELFHEEINYGIFERTLTLPEGVTLEKLTAEFKNGVLEIVAPVVAAALPRKIEIRTTPMVKQVAA